MTRMPALRFNGCMGDVGLLGKAAVDGGAVGTQHGIRIEDGPQDGGNRRGVGFGENGIGGGGAAVAHDEYGNLLAGQAALVGGTPALARWAWQIALPLVRLEEIGLRGFHDTVQVRRLDPGW